MVKINVLAILAVGGLATAFFAPIGQFVAHTIGNLARVVGGN